MRIAWILLGLLILTACQEAQPARPGLPELGEPPMMRALPDDTHIDNPDISMDGSAIGANPELDAMFGTRKSGDAAIDASDVVCRLEEKELIFRFTNTDRVAWQLNNDVPFEGSPDFVGAYVVVNNYQVNDQPYFLDGERLFGPEETFSDNCGGVEVLEPGSTVICSLTNVPLRSEGHAGGVNEIHINVPGSAEDPRVEFLC